jgi:hypothetical protein
MRNRNCVERTGTMDDTRRRRGHRNGGRPSKGARELFATRLPEPEARSFRELAEQLDVSYSELLLELHRVGMAHCNELPYARRQTLDGWTGRRAGGAA